MLKAGSCPAGRTQDVACFLPKTAWMGHLAYVGVLARDGRVHYIFVRHAEPRVVASLLVKHYSTYAKARSLIMQGECSVIGPIKP